MTDHKCNEDITELGITAINTIKKYLKIAITLRKNA
jgi:hypothetical protein